MEADLPTGPGPDVHQHHSTVAEEHRQGLDNGTMVNQRKFGWWGISNVFL
jgi:hypothetical protein